MIKSRKMRWAGYVTRMGTIRKRYFIGRDHVEGLHGDEMIILKCFVRKEVVTMWIGLN
jgi:hypothetical protein